MGPTSMSPDEIGYSRNMTQQTVTRKGHFDACHRVVNQTSCCRFIHGHSYLYELTFAFDSIEQIGYAIDFKEIKRVACRWIDDYLDHGTLLNPEDEHLFKACEATKSKMWMMSLNGAGKYCNPTAENIAKEMYIAIGFLLNSSNLKLKQIRLYETPNCFTDCTSNSITTTEEYNFLKRHLTELEQFKQALGTVEYDDRKI